MFDVELIFNDRSFKHFPTFESELELNMFMNTVQWAMVFEAKIRPSK